MTQPPATPAVPVPSASTTTVTFPDAPQGATPPHSSKELFAIARKASFAKHSNWKWLCYLGIALGVLGGVLLAAGTPVVGGVLVAIGVAAVVGIGIWLAVLNSGADDAFWTGWSAARGFEVVDAGSIPSNMPLLSEGDKRKFDRVAKGRIGAAHAHLGHYTYTVVTYTTDSEGNRHREETDHDFTVVAVDLPPAVAARFQQVHLNKSSFSFGLGGAWDKLSSSREVKLESVDFDKRYDLRIDDDQDEVALYELFSTTFIDQLSTTKHPVYWQQAGSDMLLYVEKHQESSERLDALCESVRLVHDRYLQEWQ